MAIQFATVKCPECSADLQIEDGREYAFCTYCGARVMMTNDNEKIIRQIDEARIKQAETERMVRLRELDMAEKTSVSKKILIAVWLIVSIAMVVVAVVGFAIDNEGLGGIGLGIGINVALWGALGLFVLGDNKKKVRRVVGEDEVSITTAMMDCVGYHFNKAVQLYKYAGFVNINALPLHDLVRFNLKKDGIVESITINGNDEFEEEEIYPKNANILITYHSK